MRIKLDENMPWRLKQSLTALGHSVDTVLDEGLRGAPDSDIWRQTQRDKRFLITQDLDFSDLRKFQPGSHFGLLIVRLRTPAAGVLLDRITRLFETETVESWRRCFVVVSEQKLRIFSPKRKKKR